MSATLGWVLRIGRTTDPFLTLVVLRLSSHTTQITFPITANADWEIETLIPERY